MGIRLGVATVAIALTGVVIAATAASALPDSDGPSLKIIGGSTVTSAPWAAAVFNDKKFACSGSIIDAEWVLTARHCVNGDLSVRVGSVRRASGGITRTVTESYTRFDMALLQLSSPIDTDYMALASSYPPINAATTIYGWGMTCFSGCSPSAVLKSASVRVASTTVEDAFGGRAIASYDVTGNAWYGDSGGPQVYNGAQVGVASTADGLRWQFYSSVAFNRAWIESVSGV